ncbi:MAG: dihydrofolate reductase [Parcubacteria group bacterium LiPW_15]|nr:MAG: dihydrofolate reductase [Parcubacteria group bacterium LiPW_15]
MGAKISIIAAIQKKDRGLGLKGQLLWRISEDLKRFKELTTWHPIIMGQKTFESIGRPLPNRVNIILSRQPDYQKDGCFVCSSLEEALEAARNTGAEEIFVIGGGEVYRQALPLTDKLYLTEIEGEKPADTFFPDYSEFSKIVFSRSGEGNDPAHRFLELERP